MQNESKASKNLLHSDAMQQIMAFGALIVLLIGFSIASPYFRTFDNFVGILLATTVIGVLALGATFVIINGGIDLSVGTVMTLSAVMTGVFITNLGLPIPVGIIGGLLTGTLAGFTTGNMISRMKIPPFIATLGMLYIAKGLSLVISDLRPIYFNDTPMFRELAMGSVLGNIIPGLRVPNAVLILFAAAIFAHVILTRTILGRYTFALGSNEEATRLSGVNVAVWKTAVFTLAGFFSGLGGVLIAARLNSAQPALGAGYELDAIAVSMGPGSYTGLRLGVSTAKGLCYALDIPMISISTLKSLALQVSLKADEFVIPLLDARRMEVYSAVFNDNYEQLEETKAEIIDANSFSRFLEKGKVFFLGDGAEKCIPIVKHANAEFLIGNFPSSNEMAVLADYKYNKAEFEDVAYFEPFYLKDFVAGKPKKLL